MSPLFSTPLNLIESLIVCLSWLLNNFKGSLDVQTLAHGLKCRVLAGRERLIGLFDPNWTSYEAGYAYDPKLVDIALQLGGKQ